jgi:hypothetical protein
MRKVHALALVALLAQAGCGDPAAREAPHALEGVEAAERGAAPLGAMASATPGGVPVVLRVEPDPPRSGPLRLRIQLPENEASDGGVTVDVVAPYMPAHGIVRYPAHRAGGDAWNAEIRVHMGGLWAVYVNLDHGPEAAPFEFEVADAEEAGHDHHHHALAGHD